MTPLSTKDATSGSFRPFGICAFCSRSLTVRPPPHEHRQDCISDSLLVVQRSNRKKMRVGQTLWLKVPCLQPNATENVFLAFAPCVLSVAWSSFLGSSPVSPNTTPRKQPPPPSPPAPVDTNGAMAGSRGTAATTTTRSNPPASLRSIPGPSNCHALESFDAPAVPCEAEGRRRADGGLRLRSVVDERIQIGVEGGRWMLYIGWCA